MADNAEPMLGEAQMSRFQWQIVAVMIGLNALDRRRARMLVAAHLLFLARDLPVRRGRDRLLGAAGAVARTRIDRLPRRAPPPGALRRINHTLARMGRATIAILPPAPVRPARAGLVELFAAGRARTTTTLTLAYLTHIMTFYFVLKWIPEIVVDLGFLRPNMVSLIDDLVARGWIARDSGR